MGSRGGGGVGMAIQKNGFCGLLDTYQIRPSFISFVIFIPVSTSAEPLFTLRHCISRSAPHSKMERGRYLSTTLLCLYNWRSSMSLLLMIEDFILCIQIRPCIDIVSREKGGNTRDEGRDVVKMAIAVRTRRRKKKRRGKRRGKREKISKTDIQIYVRRSPSSPKAARKYLPLSNPTLPTYIHTHHSKHLPPPSPPSCLK